MELKRNNAIRIGDVLKEFGYVTEGTITIVIDNEKHQAKKGESFYIACDKPHYLENTTNRQAKAIWISSPPSF